MKRKFLTAILAMNMTFTSLPLHAYTNVYAAENTILTKENTVSTNSAITIDNDIQSNIKLEFSNPGGFYKDNVKLELKVDNPNAKIYYTLDASEPTTSSAIVYKGPIEIKKEIVDKNNGVSYIPTTPLEAPEEVGLQDWIWKSPVGDLDKAVVVKAFSVDENGIKSDTVTQTYWVNESGKKYTLPVVSIVTDKNNFFDDKTGIYVPGDTYKNDNGWSRSLWGNGNYKNKTDDWTKPIHIEFYDEKGTSVFSQYADTKIKGTASSSLPQKSLKVYLDKYGNSGISSSLFPDVKDSKGKDVNNYKRIILRDAGQGFLFSFFQDALTQRLAKDMNIDTEGYKPVIVFINGEYFGIQNLRENYDKYYVQAHYGSNAKKVDMIKSEATEADGLTADEGDKTAYNDMISFIRSSDMKDLSNYGKINTLIDIDNYIKYNVAEIYCENTDWPDNNVELWRSKNNYNPSADYGLDGRWRFMLHDTDSGFGSSKVYDHDSIQEAKQSEIFAKLLDNDEFKNKFVNTMADSLNTTFEVSKTLKTIDDMQNAIKPEMQQHIDRWGYPAPTVDGWNKNVDMMRDFAKQRPDYVRQHFIKDFNLGGQATVSLSIPNSSEGKVQVNSLTQDKLLTNNNTTTWQGIYFKDIPISLKATPQKGYAFSHWEGIDSDSDKNKDSINLTLKNDLSLKPCFVKINDRTIEKPVGLERTIKFTKPVDESMINDKNIYISTDEEGTTTVQGISLSIDKSNPCNVKLNPPQEGWKQGQNYYIFITPAVKSTEGKAINKMIRCKFIIN